LLPPVLFARRRERFLFWYCCALLIIVPTAAVFGALWDGAVGMVVVYTPVYCVTMIVMANKALDCGRDTHYWAPPAQNRTGSFPAYGSHLGWLTAGLGLPYALRRRWHAFPALS